MLRGIHNVSKNWIGRIVTGVVLGLIAISFAVWGIGDIFRGFGRSTLAKIGDTEIGVEQFRQTYNERVQQLSRRLGRPLPPDQARALGLDRQLLAQLLAEAALDENVRNMGLGLSDAEIIKRITGDPNFRGATGQFDQARFAATIRNAGYNEARYVAEQRRVSLRRQIAEAITGNVAAPVPATEAVHRFDNEERAIEYVTLGTAQAGTIADPAPDVLAKYYEDNKILFRAPEYRKLILLTLSPVEIAKWIEVSDADARKIYDDNRTRYVTPERREVQQIVFPNADEAKAAAAKLAGGTSFSALATERGMKESDINLGLVTKAQILDEAVADAAFALKAESVSEPVTGRFGTVIVRAGKIEPEKVRAFEEASAEIKRDRATELARTRLNDTRDKIEDERGAGLPLAEVAQKVTMPTKTIEAVDRSGRNPDGNPVADLPQGADVVSAAFASDVGAENEPVQIPGGGFVWYEVAAVTPSRDRPFEEVKDKVAERWRNEQVATRLKQVSAEILDKLKTGSMADATAALGVKPQTATGLKRRKSADGLPARALSDIFRAEKGTAGETEGDQPTERIVFRVTDIAVPKLDPASAEAKRIIDALKATYADELVAQYVTKLETELGTTINESALAQVHGGGGQQN
jgi:peptidyl-prolyl cis-trans isomerase D